MLKVIIVLEELQVLYEIVSFEFEKIKKKPFIDLNPNGRVPGTVLNPRLPCLPLSTLMR